MDSVDGTKRLKRNFIYYFDYLEVWWSLGMFVFRIYHRMEVRGKSREVHLFIVEAGRPIRCKGCSSC